MNTLASNSVSLTYFIAIKKKFDSGSSGFEIKFSVISDILTCLLTRP